MIANNYQTIRFIVEHKHQPFTALMKRGLVEEVAFNKVKKGYIKGPMFDEIISQ